MKLLDTPSTTPPTRAELAAAVVNTAQLVLRLVRGAVRRQHPVNLSVTQLRALDFVSANPGTSLSAVADYVGLALPSASDRKSTRLNSSHRCISYAVFCLKKKTKYHDCGTAD